MISWCLAWCRDYIGEISLLLSEHDSFSSKQHRHLKVYKKIFYKKHINPVTKILKIKRFVDAKNAVPSIPRQKEIGLQFSTIAGIL